MSRTTKVGDWVRLKAMPTWAAARSVETQRILAHAIGKTYQVTAIHQGLYELGFGTEVDRLFGGLHSHLYMEPEWFEPSAPRFNLASEPNAFGEVVHCGIYLAKTLKSVGAQHCIDDEDPLNVGPSRFEPAEHEQVRARFFAERELRTYGELSKGKPQTPTASTTFAERIHGSSNGRPIVLWVGTSLRERFWLWWISDGFSRSDFSDRELWLVAPQDWWIETHAHLFALPLCSGEELEELVPSAIPIDSATLRAFQECWRWFCSGTGEFPVVPRPSSWTQRWDWIRSAPEPFRFLLPQPGHLAWFDVELLSMLSATEWRTPISLVAPYESFQHYGPMMQHCGDWAIPDRMVAWSQHAIPGVEMRRLAPGYAFSNCEFRLTPHGSELLRRRRVQIGDAPQLELGGFRYYDVPADHLRAE